MAKFQIDGTYGRLTAGTAGYSRSTLALNGAASGGYSATWLAFYIVPQLGGTLSKVRVYATAVNGTLGASDLVCDIYSSSSSNPNTSLASSSTVTSTPTGAAWVEFTGFSQSLTVGTPYFIVLRNANGTPTTNYPTYISAWSNATALGTASDPVHGTILSFSSTNSGSTWSRLLAPSAFVLDYGSGNIEGFPAYQVSSSYQVYSSREVGLKFTSPNVALNVIGIGGLVAKAGTPTGNLRYRIYTGSSTSPTLLATTLTAAPGEINTGRSIKILYFSTPITLPASTVTRIVISETTQSDTSANRYTGEALQLSSTDTGLILPFTVQPASTLSTDGGATFADTSDECPALFLVLDQTNQFSVSGGASSYTFLG